MPDVPFRNGPFRYPAVPNASTKFSPMAERPGEHVGVEECKSLRPPNVSTTSASITRLALGSLDFNTRVPDTGTATPSKRRLTESQRLAHLAKKTARYAQKTEGQRLNDAHRLRARRARQQQQANVNAATEATLQAQLEETTRRAGNYSAVVRCTELLNRRTRRMPVRVLAIKSTVYTLNCLRHTHHLVCATLLYRLYTATLATAAGKRTTSNTGFCA